MISRNPIQAIILLFLSLILTNNLSAYNEPGAFNLKVPTGIKSGNAEFKIQHRFAGKINEDPFNTLFGMYMGANINLSLRYIVWSKLELEGSYSNYSKESSLCASYSYSFPLMKALLGGQFFSYEEYNLDKKSFERKSSIMGLLSVQTEPIIKRIILTIDIGYDGYEKKPGAGLGASIIILERPGTLKKLILIGEYFPTKLNSDVNNCYCFGLRAETYGHHFDFIISNGSEIGLRRLMLGTVKEEGLYFGFNIKRLIERG